MYALSLFKGDERSGGGNNSELRYMAKSIKLTSGSLLIGSPIMVTVTSESGLSNATFHRVKLIVTAALSTDGKSQVFELSAPAGSNEDVEFDISTALRSVASGYEHSKVSAATTYPYISYTLKAYDEWMLNGILTEEYNVQISPSSGSHYALMGAFTDMERALSNGTESVKAFTRKPAQGEVCAKGEILVYPAAVDTPLKITDVISSGPTISLVTLNTDGQQVYGGRTIYVDPNAKNRILFQFVNGYGVVETISAETLEEVGSSGTTEVDIITAPSSFNKPRAEVARRSDRRTVYKCSSGYVNKEWAEWWVTEFLGGDAFRRSGHSQCWVFLGGNWLPCTVVPDDDITLYDRSKPGLIHVDFEVRIL